MSEVTATNAPMDDSLERLCDYAKDTTTSGGITFLDAVNTTAVALTRRPGDIDRTAWMLYQLCTEVSYLRGELSKKA